MTQPVVDKKTVFFFEDDHLYMAPRIKRLLERPSAKPGSPVLEVKHYVRAQNAFDAIEQWKDRPPDVALLDVQEDGYTDAGIDICKRIRERWKGEVPVMFLSNRYEIADRIRGREAEALTYMSKEHIDEPGYEEEIRAAVVALTRSKPSSEEVEIYRSGSLYVNMATGEAHWREKKLRLSQSDLEIVHELAKPRRQVGTTRTYSKLAEFGTMASRENSHNDDRSPSQKRIAVRQRIYQIREAFHRVDEEFKTAWQEKRHGIIAFTGGYYWLPDSVVVDNCGSERDG